MSFLSWLSGLMGSAPTMPDAEYINQYLRIVGETCFRDLAYSAAKSMLANSISKCEFKTIQNGAEAKGAEWYLWNVEPNKNENSSRFLRKIVNRLCDNNECLVIEQGGQLLVADSFAKKDYTLYEDVFSQVTVGELVFSRPFVQSEVLYWKLADKNIKQALDALNASYAKMIAAGMASFKSVHGNKGILNIEAFPPHASQPDEQKQWITDQVAKHTEYMNADNGVLVQGRGLNFVPFGKSQSGSNETSRDIRAMVGDIFDFTALAFGIPPALLRGEVEGTGDATDNLLTFAVDPWADFFREEIVRKRIGLAGVKNGFDLIVDTSQIKHVDIMSSSTQIDKLIGSGAFSVNDILKLLGRPTINEPWADQHYITKNYALIEEVLKALTGGGENK